jgi:WD40 repeat protein
MSSDGRIIATGTRDRAVKLWDLATQQLIGTLPVQNTQSQDVAFCPRGLGLASGNYNGTIKVWRGTH